MLVISYALGNIVLLPLNTEYSITSSHVMFEDFKAIYITVSSH